MSTPCPCWLRSMASSMRLRACAWSSSQPRAIASMGGISPTIFCVAATSSCASGPWVMISSPIIPSFLVDVAMGHAGGPSARGQHPCRRLGRGDGAVLPPRASDRDGEIALSFLDETGEEKAQEVVEACVELLELRQVVEKREDLGVEPCLPLEPLHEERVLQEPDVEDQVRLHGDAVLEAEGDDRRLQGR